MNEQDLQAVAVNAWNATKTEEQPEFSALNPDYKTRLYAEVKAVETFGPTEGNGFHAAVRNEITALMIDQNADAALLVADEGVGATAVVDKADGTSLTQDEVAALKADFEAETGREVSQVQTLEEYTGGDAALAQEIEAQVQADEAAKVVSAPDVTATRKRR